MLLLLLPPPLLLLLSVFAVAAAGARMADLTDQNEPHPSNPLPHADLTASVDLGPVGHQRE